MMTSHPSNGLHVHELFVAVIPTVLRIIIIDYTQTVSVVMPT